MNDKKISISIQSGDASIGNIVQGDNNIIDSDNNEVVTEQSVPHFDKFFQELNELKETGKASDDKISALEIEMKSLMKIKDTKNFSNSMKKMYEKYSWAIEPLKKLFSAILS